MTDVTDEDDEERELFKILKAGLEEALEHEEGKETSVQIHEVEKK